MITNCLDEQHHEISKLKLRVAELQSQLNLIRGSSPSQDQEETSTSAPLINTLLNPSFKRQCRDSATPFTFGFGGKFSSAWDREKN
jgi:hypothetical protein